MRSEWLVALVVLVTSMVTTHPRAVLGSAQLRLRSQDPKAVESAHPLPQDDIDALRRALMQPGAGAKMEREGAVDALLLRRELLAHQVLARSLAEGDDADGRNRFLLDNLARKLVQAADPVFGDERLRAQILTPYFDAFVLLWVEGEKAPPAAAPELRRLAMRCVRNLSFKERRTELDRVANGGDPDQVRAALRIAGRSRDIGLGEWIADRLAKPELQASAQRALADLTLVEEPFTDRAAYDTWFYLTRPTDYIQLAEDAARRANDTVRRVREDAEVQYVAQTARLVAAMARAENPDWKAIGVETMRSTPVALTSACLRALRDAMADRAVIAKLGGIVADRQEFARSLRDLLARRDDRPQDYALVLETMAYLAVKDDEVQRGATEERLVAALQRADAEVRRAALRGLRRFPSNPNRDAVLGAIDTALGGNDVATLTEAFSCLGSTSWVAPDAASPDRAHWIATIGRTLRAPGLDATLAERALQVAVQRDGAGNLVDDVFPVLAEIAADVSRAVAVRRIVVQRMVAFARDDERADRYFDLVLNMLDDADPGLRRLAASQLATLPEVSRTKRDNWRERIVERGSKRLSLETDEAALREICARLLTVADQENAAELVLQGYVAAVRAVIADPQGPSAEVRKKVLADSLKLLGSVRSRKLAEWVTAGKALLELRARDELRKLLERQDVTNLPLTEPRDPALIDGLQLVIAAARLEQSRASWRDRAAEADEVRRAFEQLEKLKVAINTPGDIELRLTILRDLDRSTELTAAVRSALAIPNLSVEARGNALIAGINNDLREGSLPADLDDAERLLRNLEEIGSANGRTLDLWSALARRRYDSGDATGAARIAGDVLTRTAADAPSWRERFLIAMEARAASSDPAQRAALLEEIRSQAARFGDDTARELSERFRALLKSCGG